MCAAKKVCIVVLIGSCLKTLKISMKPKRKKSDESHPIHVDAEKILKKIRRLSDTLETILFIIISRLFGFRFQEEIVTSFVDNCHQKHA